MTTDPQVREISRQYYHHKEKWLMESIKPHIPPIVYRWAMELKHMPEIAKYFHKRGITINVYVNDRKTEILMCDGKEIARFSWKPFA